MQEFCIVWVGLNNEIIHVFVVIAKSLREIGQIGDILGGVHRDQTNLTIGGYA
jgi:rRNA processing protein Gar1